MPRHLSFLAFTPQGKVEDQLQWAPVPTLVQTMALQDINPLGVKLYVLLIVSLVLVWIFSMLRAYAKLIVLRKVSLDDGLMLVSVVRAAPLFREHALTQWQFIFSTHASISIWGITYASMEAHVDHAQSHSIALYTWFISEVLYAPLSALIRTSIAVFLLRIPPTRAYRFIIYANILVVWILCVAYFFLLVFQCNPPSHFYMQVLGQPGSWYVTSLRFLRLWPSRKASS